MRLPGDLGQLTYCLNIHPAETWAEARAALTGPVKAVKDAVCPDVAFAVGLRFSAIAVEELAEAEALEDLKAIIAENDYRAITVNGFPYGPFHGTRVKEDVYQPDWRTADRLAYTTALAELMAQIGPAGEPISLSTVPGTFKPLGKGAEEAMADRLLRAAAYCCELERSHGKQVAIAIEPEPFCFLETIAETVAYFGSHLYSPAACEKFAQWTGMTAAEAAEAIPRHLGLCYDVCHAAVEYEDPAASLAALRDAGIPVHKLQLSAALRVASVDAAAREALRAFDEPTYLHQVIARRDGVLTPVSDLPEALARGAAADGEEWRVHFHVPIFVDRLPAFGATQDFLAEILALHAAAPISPHLEVETYTWGVLPDDLGGASIEDAVTRELRWVLDRLSCEPA
jgi:hypothetical protein